MEKNDELIKKYRGELFGTIELDNSRIKALSADSNLIPDDELREIFQLNMADMVRLINEKEINKEEVKKLLIANLNFYKIAKERKISLHGYNFLPVVSDAIGYNTDKVHSILNVGAYYRAQRPEDQSHLTNKR